MAPICAQRRIAQNGRYGTESRLKVSRLICTVFLKAPVMGSTSLLSLESIRCDVFDDSKTGNGVRVALRSPMRGLGNVVGLRGFRAASGNRPWVLRFLETLIMKKIKTSCNPVATLVGA